MEVRVGQQVKIKNITKEEYINYFMARHKENSPKILEMLENWWIQDEKHMGTTVIVISDDEENTFLHTWRIPCFNFNIYSDNEKQGKNTFPIDFISSCEEIRDSIKEILG